VGLPDRGSARRTLLLPGTARPPGFFRTLLTSLWGQARPNDPIAATRRARATGVGARLLSCRYPPCGHGKPIGCHHRPTNTGRPALFRPRGISWLHATSTSSPW
jgi:hypothetical protein